MGGNIGYRGRKYYCCQRWKAGQRERNKVESCCDFMWAVDSDDDELKGKADEG